MFAKRHFEALAALVKEARQFLNDNQSSKLEDLLIQLFKRHNPDFKEERFRRACKPGANVKARS